MTKGLAFLSRLALSLSVASSTFALSAFAAPYELGFDTRPSYIPNNVVVLTFDDGPDWNNTAKVLDVLKQKNAKASFFINSENWSSLSQDAPMQDLVRRMVNEGHELGNHTAHHYHLPDLSAADVEFEIADVERDVNSIFGANAPKMTLLRAPHGEPYQDNDPSNPSAAYNKVAPIVAKRAVHIGWNIDSFDYNCPVDDADCVYNNVIGNLQTVGNGNYGVILMHSVHSQTAAALPRIIDYIRSHGFQLWTTEDVVRARYGKSSSQLIYGGGNTPSQPGSSNGAVPFEVGGEYNIVAKHSGKCLDIDGPSTADGAKAQQWACANKQPNQRFRVDYAGHGLYFLKSVYSDKCLDVTASGTANGVAIQQYTCNWSQAQQISLTTTGDGGYHISFVNSGRCADVRDGSTADGAKLQQWDCGSNPQQTWFFKK